MAEKERYDAGREALREVTDHPERAEAQSDARLLRYLGGVAYHEKQDEARQAPEEPTEEGGR
jgi:hypothetical protein